MQDIRSFFGVKSGVGTAANGRHLGQFVVSHNDLQFIKVIQHHSCAGKAANDEKTAVKRQADGPIDLTEVRLSSPYLPTFQHHVCEI